MLQADERELRLIEYLENKGYKSDTVDGFKVISDYGSLADEVESLYRGVGLRNASHFGIIELKGKDVMDFLHRISTNSIKDLAKEGVRHTLFTSEKGRIIGLTTLLNFEDYQLLFCDRHSKPFVLAWLKKYVIADDVQVNDANGKYNLLELRGPQADSFVTMICGNVVNEMKPDSFKIIHFENLLFFLAKITDERGHNKFWMLGDFENAKRLIEYMQENKGPFNFNLVGEKAFNIYRVEMGIPAAPNELNSDYNPHEAGLTNYIDFEKGCYIGQEVIARLQTYDKVQKQLTGVRFSGQDITSEQLSIFNGDEEVGKITSMVNSVKFNELIGLAYVKKNFTNNKDQLTAKNGKGIAQNISLNTLPFTK